MAVDGSVVKSALNPLQQTTEEYPFLPFYPFIHPASWNMDLMTEISSWASRQRTTLGDERSESWKDPGSSRRRGENHRNGLEYYLLNFEVSSS